MPALGTAIGSSGDRPDALADLMGIILNDGVRLPTVDLQRLHFAAGTPYDTEMAVDPKPQRVLAPEIAAVVRQALSSVVAEGTARRLNGVYRAANGNLLPVGGKTGTGDNRVDHFGGGGRLISQRVLDRTATFVFFLGDRFYGTITAYVPGAIAGSYHFTSAMTVQLLKSIQPQFEPLLSSPPTGAAHCRGTRGSATQQKPITSRASPTAIRTITSRPPRSISTMATITLSFRLASVTTTMTTTAKMGAVTPDTIVKGAIRGTRAKSPLVSTR